MLSPACLETANRIKELLKELPDDRRDAVRLDELRRIFGKLVETGDLDFSSSNHNNRSSKNDATARWRRFLWRSHKQFLQQLSHRISLGKRTAMRTFWGVIASSPARTLHGHTIVSSQLVLDWVKATILMPSIDDKTIRHMVSKEFLEPYRDVQYYVMVAVAVCASELYRAQQESVDSTDEASLELMSRIHMLIELSQMIPIPTSLQDFESTGRYLFPPAANAVTEVDESSEDDDDASSEDNEDEQVIEEENSDSDDDSNEPPMKRSRVAATRKNSNFAFQTVRGHRRVWSKAWLALLKLQLPQPLLKRALQFLPKAVLPNVPTPLLFADFFMSAYDSMGVLPFLALDGLFVLMTQHALEYPNFYKQLYRLVTPRLMYVKYRVGFFRLLDKCLSHNEMLPAHVVAAFVKRLARSSLSAPPPAILVCLALVSNLLRRHPETTCLVHRSVEVNGDDGTMADGFDADTEDPEKANALASSLWELEAFSKHYYPPVVTLAESIGRSEELKAPLHNLEDFLGQTYKSAFDFERKRKRKGKTPVTFVKPTALFTKDDVFAGILEIPSVHDEKNGDMVRVARSNALR